jgi:hypothetical protein
MREELLGPKVENVAIVVAKEVGEDNEVIYNVYLLNLREDIMEGIIITSKGYGVHPDTGEKIKTSTLRHCLEVMLPNEAAKIEPIMEDVFALANEYWVSFWVEDVMYDKKFVFVPGSITEENMIDISQLGVKGVLIK